MQQKKSHVFFKKVVDRKRLKSDDVDIASFDVDKYWNVLEDAERRGNKFMDIARDIADTEKKTVFSYMGWTDMNGNLYDFPKSVIKFIGLIFILGIACCFMMYQRENSFRHSRWGMNRWPSAFRFAVSSCSFIFSFVVIRALAFYIFFHC
ncbi:hypothetical protein, partial [Butyrivibrio sp. WCD2001]|uniref:hypothetical protein n=1 Tax=Butyrivibrio sp. WCD2001 TaxID=1280681 RepID=UPI0018C94FCB